MSPYRETAVVPAPRAPRTTLACRLLGCAWARLVFRDESGVVTRVSWACRRCGAAGRLPAGVRPVVRGALRGFADLFRRPSSLGDDPAHRASYAGHWELFRHPPSYRGAWTTRWRPVARCGAGLEPTHEVVACETYAVPRTTEEGDDG